MAARKTAAQKAAEAAERDEYTGTGATVEAPAAPEDPKPKKETLQQLKNRLRNEAEREVLDAHKPEVIERTAAKYKVHNLDYVRRLSEEEKAAKAIEEYYVKFPKLRPQLQQQQAQREIDVPEYAPSGTKEPLVQAVQGGALEEFRNGGFTDGPDPDEDPEYYRDEVEQREGE